MKAVIVVKMRSRFALLLSAFVLAGTLLAIGGFPAAREASAAIDEGRVIVELEGLSSAISIADRPVTGTDNSTKQPYKYKQERYGKDFHYVLSGLSQPYYDVEFSMVESFYDNPGQRVFSVTANGSELPGLTGIDLLTRAAKFQAYQVTVTVPVVDGKIDFRLNAGAAEATLCNLRLSWAGQSMLELNMMETRNWSAFPLRFVNGSGQNAYETILGRLGSRFMINPVPQLLGWRQSPLGTWSSDLSELVLAFKDAGGDIRCLPFTDRYPVFSSINQQLTMTGVRYQCADPSLPFTVTVNLRAPFYPRDTKLSSAPFFYVDIQVTNTGGSAVNGSFLLVKPHKDDNTGGSAPQALSGTAKGYKYGTRYTYGDESHVLPDSNSGYVDCQEAVAIDDETGVGWHYADITAGSWIWGSPSGYPLPYRHKVYSFVPSGYSGLDWSFSLGSGATQSRSLVLAGYATGTVLNVGGDSSYRFLYSKASGPNLASIDAVADYALGSRPAIIEECDFFDGAFSDPYLTTMSQSGHDLMASALQSFLANTWWVYNGGGNEWFSVWEGTCMFHSTIDVEYNDSWFYLYFWPDLLKKLLGEWPQFQKANGQGCFLSHDMGSVANVTGMAYSHDMPVEENTNYILLLYSYWKSSNDTAFMKAQFSKVRDYANFIFNCDTDGDGLPDLNTANTIDQGSPAIQNSRNQTYLGVKALGAYRAAREMAAAQDVKDQAFMNNCDAGVRLINITLGDKLWLGDHFAVCADYSVPAQDREAYSLYASNGLLYLLAAGLDSGLTSANLARFQQDIASAAAANERRYGSVHTSKDNENEWVSQDLWRDALGYWLGVNGWGAGQQARLDQYMNLERYYATKKNGGFWDVCAYNDYYFLGTSEANASGFSDSSAAADYLRQANMEAGGMRGAYSLDAAYQQSLGYYPRGTTVFSLISAMGRLCLDRPGGYLLYNPGQAARIPVFSCADWGAAASARIPVLTFDGAGNLQSTANPGLLPAHVTRSSYNPITDLKAQPFSCSPGTGARDNVTVTYDAPAGAVTGAQVLNGTQSFKSISPAPSGFQWNGTDNFSQEVPDGVYRMYLQTQSTNPSVLTPPDMVDVGVNTDVPSPARTWYLAEGFTGSNASGGRFDTWVLVENANDQPANITATFMQPGGSTTRRAYGIPAHARFTIHVNDILPDSEVSTRIDADLPVIVERAMYFNGRKAGHDSIGVTAPSNKWYLAEGYTGGNFDEWVLIQNPNDAAANINVQFQTQERGVVDRSYGLDPHSRFTIHADDILPDAQVSTYIEADRPVVVERAQYLNDMKSGTDSIGASAPSYSWYFAEGYTSEGFEEWLLVQNPSDSPALVDLTFMQLDGSNSGVQFTVPPRSRYTVPVDQYLPDAQVSSRLTSNIPVVAERAMYWKNRSDGHDTIGTPCPEYNWYFAEGYTAEGYEEWLLIQNPNASQASVNVDFMFPGGSTRSLAIPVPGRSRFTLNVGGIVGPTEVSLKLASDLPVVAERAMYFNQRSGGTFLAAVEEAGGFEAG
jgi:hypothetical protein